MNQVKSDYQILKSRDVGELEMRVNQYLENGFQLAGGIATCVELYPGSPPRFNFCQAVVKLIEIPDPDAPVEPDNPDPEEPDPTPDPEEPDPDASSTEETNTTIGNDTV